MEAEQPLKLARMATSLAARLFNSPDGTRLTVDPEHVEYIAQYLQRLYDNKHFGYDSWSVNRNSNSKIGDKDEILAFCKRLGWGGCYHLLDLEKVRCRDIEEYLGVTTDEAKMYISRLLNNNAIKRCHGDFYRKSNEFNNMLREFAQARREPDADSDRL
jgi:hypothetical protein